MYLNLKQFIIKVNLKNNQKFIEFSPLSYNYLKIISKKINQSKGGLLIIEQHFEDRDFEKIDELLLGSLIKIKKCLKK